MTYESLVYGFVFLPLCLAAYQIVPQRWRRRVLLVFSYLFFWLISRNLIVYLLGTTVFVHCIGIWLEWLKSEQKTELASADRSEKKKIKGIYQQKSRRVLAFGVLALLGILAYLKYYNFFVSNVTGILGNVLPFTLEQKKILMPIGISFYTLQAIGYMADVYWGKIRAEGKLEKTALFLAFFPQIMEGPICRYSDTSDTLYEGRPLNMDNLTSGYIRIFWGLFKKKVIADRLAIAVGMIFSNYTSYSGVVIAAGAIAYTIQLYMEFSGCMDIIIGSGELFGIRLPENFRQPFCAQSAAEFWRRWHISLGTWFKTYIFYPVSMSSPVKKWNQYGRKHLGKYITMLGTSAIALFPVWICNGLWHGARWSYIFYGMYYFTLILLGIAVEPVRDRILNTFHISDQSVWLKFVRIAKTWVIIFTGELFFRADGLRAGISMFRSIFTDFDLNALTDGSLFNLGLGRADMIAIAVGCVVVAVVGSVKERGTDVRKSLFRRPVFVRWALCYALMLAVIVVSAYGDGYQTIDMIYAGF
ncbi:MAG TPA: MBOAT family protein [Candidatus Mediterraneibacter ornithocaccae]|nr:MBOAT family protein [Candidatus Mediterraneibacter ornithocaccae]